MPQNDGGVSAKLASAKNTLAHAEQSFPSSAAPASSAVTPKVTPKPMSAPTIGDELMAKKAMVDKAVKALPRMHKGGPVIADGAYQLKAGEHVLTAKEAMRARSHALVAAGMRSMATPMNSNGFEKGSTGDKHVETAKHDVTAPAPKMTMMAGKKSPVTPNGKVSKHNLRTASTNPKDTDKGSKKMASMAKGMSKMGAARGKVIDGIKVRPEGAVKKDLVS